MGLHALCLYAGLAIFALSAIPVYVHVWKGSHLQRHNRAEGALIKSLALAVAGAALKLFSYINYTENGIFGWYCAGHLLICLSIAVTTTLSVLVTKYLWKDQFALVDTLGVISFGMVISFVFTHIIYSDTDRFFTKAGRAQTKGFWIMVL